MSYATFEDEESQLPAAPKRTCSIRRVSVALVVTVGLVYAAASGTMDHNRDGIVSSDEIKSAMTEYDEESDDIDPWAAFAAGSLSLIGLFNLMTTHPGLMSLCF